MILRDTHLRYSVCITTRNNIATIENSLRSIVGQLDRNFEVIVVDSKSDDGSAEVLRRFEKEGRIRLIELKCSRGRGRQVALEASKGEVIISNLDTDEVYSPSLSSLLGTYDALGHGGVLLAISSSSKEERERQNITIGTRELLQEIGGWRDVNYGEDWDLWRRAAERGRFSIVVFSLVTGADPSPEKTSKTLRKLRLRYTRYVSLMQLGRPVFQRGSRITYAQWGVFAVARIAALFKPKYAKNAEFDCYDPKFLVQATADTGRTG